MGPSRAGDALFWDGLLADRDSKKPDSPHPMGAEGLLCARPDGATAYVASEASSHGPCAGAIAKQRPREVDGSNKWQKEASYRGLSGDTARVSFLIPKCSIRG